MLTRAKTRAKSPIAQKSLLEKGMFGSVIMPDLATKLRVELANISTNDKTVLHPNYELFAQLIVDRFLRAFPSKITLDAFPN